MITEVITVKRPRRLSAAFVKAVRTPGRYGDGRGGYGLSLLVKAMKTSGRLSKSWSQRVRVGPKLTNIGLGAYPLMSLADARAAALDNARLIQKGIDPRTGGVPTFADAWERVIAMERPNWRNPKSEAQWRASIRDYAGSLQKKRIGDITTADVLGVLTPIWNTKRETARKVRGRLARVFAWAVVEGYREDNPAQTIAAVLPKGQPRKHLRAVPHHNVAQAIAKVRASGAYVSTRLSLEFTILTAARSGEVRLATWPEVDMDAAAWIVPASRMKAKREHRVPLADRAIGILLEAAELADGSGLVFPSVTGKALSDNTLSKLLRDNAIEGTVHGFRSSFRDWCAETGKPREIAEAALAHKVAGVEGAYFRSDLFERRRRLMDAWARYLSDYRASVVPIRG